MPFIILLKHWILFCFCFFRSNPTSLQQLIEQLVGNLKLEEQDFDVRRGHVLDDLLRGMAKKNFHPLKRVSVSM